MRRYEYYQRHKSSVDLYGTIIPDMVMSNEEVEKLKEYLKKKHNERKQYLEEINNINFNSNSISADEEEKTIVLKKTRKPNK